MVINFAFVTASTPLDPNEAAGLIPSHISNNAQLNEWEMANILEGEHWAFSRKRNNLLEIDFIRQLHKRMFGNTWRWAGTFRTTEKNIGIDPLLVQAALLDLSRDVKTQLEYKSYSLDEIAARYSHRMVAIHPFANGNGRFLRTIADLLLVQNGAERFTWGADNLSPDRDERRRYIDALQAADRSDYSSLLTFVRS